MMQTMAEDCKKEMMEKFLILKRWSGLKRFMSSTCVKKRTDENNTGPY